MITTVLGDTSHLKKQKKGAGADGTEAPESSDRPPLQKKNKKNLDAVTITDYDASMKSPKERKMDERTRGREIIWGPGHDYSKVTTACILEAMGTCVSKGYSGLLQGLHNELLRRAKANEACTSEQA